MGVVFEFLHQARGTLGKIFQYIRRRARAQLCARASGFRAMLRPEQKEPKAVGFVGPRIEAASALGEVAQKSTTQRDMDFCT